MNPYFTLITGNFNARYNRWWENDSNNTEGVSIDNLTSSYGLKQLFAKPTLILPPSSSCIDLLFTKQSNMVVNSSVFRSILGSDTASQITRFSRECFLRHYGGQLKTAVEQQEAQAGKKIDWKR